MAERIIYDIYISHIRIRYRRFQLGKRIKLSHRFRGANIKIFLVRHNNNPVRQYRHTLFACSNRSVNFTVTIKIRTIHPCYMLPVADHSLRRRKRSQDLPFLPGRKHRVMIGR